METFFQDLLKKLNLSDTINELLIFLLIVVSTGVLALVVYFFTRKFENKYIKAFAYKSKTKWDDYMVDRGVFRYASLLMPLFIFQVFLKSLTFYQLFMSKLINILTVFVIVMILNSLLDVCGDIYKNYKISKEHPIKSYLQVMSLVISIFSVIITIGIIFDKSPLKLLSGIGAMTAIVMLIFKDAILGFVASIQLTANKMVAIGDWIEMPSHDADGEVVEINLTNVKVENWDKTISTIPSYTLVSNSFRNWKGMTQSGGRRIKRSIFIDSSTVRFLKEDEINRLSKINLLKNYIESKSRELAEHNKNSKIEENIVNGRKLTNIGTFRIYIENYLHNSENIDKGKTILVRQLQQTSEGIPMEIYCFANTTVWNAYEKIQSDLFDHFMAIIPEFELQLFQNPSGRDLKSLKN